MPSNNVVCYYVMQICCTEILTALVPLIHRAPVASTIERANIW